MTRNAFRVIRLLAILLIVSFATFLMIDLVPGDPAAAILGPDATVSEYDAMRERLGLNEPTLVRYWHWIGDLVQGDLGRSVVPPIREVSSVVANAFPVTLQIAVTAMFIAVSIAVPVGAASAYRRGGRFDRSASSIAFAITSIPSFLKALLLVFVFVLYPHIARNGVSIGLVMVAALVGFQAIRRSRFGSPAGERWSGASAIRGLAAFAGLLAVALLASTRWPDFPRQGFVRLTSSDGVFASIRSTLLPALALGLTEAAVLTRVLRADMIATLDEDFILAARSRGLSSMRIVLRHALRPSSFSLFTVAGVSLGRLIGGTVVVEAIFRIPGIGTMLIQSIVTKDYPLVQACVLLIAATYIIVNSFVDFVYTLLDPRLRRERAQ